MRATSFGQHRLLVGSTSRGRVLVIVFDSSIGRNQPKHHARSGFAVGRSVDPGAILYWLRQATER
jgi:hypothetical protein